jgi:DNA polymerase-1
VDPAAGRVVVAADPVGGGGRLCAVGEDGGRAGETVAVADLAAAVRDVERAGGPRWVWAGAEQV